MSRTRLPVLLIPALLIVLACQAVTNPISGVKDIAGTAESIATSAIEMSTQIAPLSTALAGTLEAPTSSAPDAMDATATIPDELFNPQGTPLSSWKEIPIMPEATAGAEVQSVYSFKVNGTLKEVHDFYAAALPPLGWSSVFSAEGTPFEVYQKGNQTLTITITEQDGSTIVLLAMG